MAEEHAAVVHRFQEAFASGGVDAALALVHPDVVVDEPPELPFGGRFMGHDGFRLLVALIGEHANASWQGFEVSSTSTGAVAWMELRFTGRRTGRSVVTTVVERYEVVDDLLHRVDVYYKDPRAVASLVADERRVP